MSLLDSFTKPGWQHRKPEVRKAAIDELDDQETLVELVLTDPDPGVRAHALARVGDGEKLDRLADNERQQLPAVLQQQARKQRLQQLLPDEGALQSITDDATLIRIASLTDDGELITRAIGRISSNGTLMEVADGHPSARARLNAAQCIGDAASLKQLMTRAKHRDKAVYQYCKEQVDKAHAAAQAEAERQQQIHKLAEEVSRLRTAVDSPAYKGRFQTLEQRWKGLEPFADADLQKRIQDDLDTCAKRIEVKEKAQAAEEEKQALSNSAAQTFSQVVEELSAITANGLDTADAQALERFNTRLQDQEDRWLGALHHAQPSSELTAECKRLLQHWRSVVQTSKQVLDRMPILEKLGDEIDSSDKSDFTALQKLRKRAEKQLSTLPWPDSLETIQPLPIRSLHEQMSRLQELLETLKEQEKGNIEKLEAAFKQLRAELDTDHFRDADRALNKLRNLMRRLSPEKQQRFQNELKPLTARLGEIHDWQGFAIEPKKIELIEHMQALIGSAENPNVLAGRIKSLQMEWKKLGPLSPRRDQALWKRFSAAADEAYEPCREAFAQQAEFRKENFRLRMGLVAQLVDYEQRMHWPDPENPDSEAPQPDWKKVQKTLDTARAAFADIKPVDRKGERKSRKALKKVCDRIYSHIREEYGRNIEQKKELIARAREIAELEDLQQAIEKAKRIQREWKDVGMTPMKVDRRLWKEFRSACDAVFARLDAERAEQDAAFGARVGEAESLLKKARELLDSKDDEERLHLRKNLAELNAALREIELPGHIRKKFGRRFADMEREARAVVGDIRERREQEKWQRLLDRIQACALKPDDEKKASKAWEQEGDNPKAVDSEALEAFWQEGPGDADEKELREACIALEILAGIESPPEEKEARMAYQMQRLVEGMGHVQASRTERLLELINSFIAMRPPAAWSERFCRGVEQARKLS